MNESIPPDLDTVVLFAHCKCEIAESPAWHDGEQFIYWIDVPRGNVYRKSYKGDDGFEVYELGLGKMGGMAKTDDGWWLLFGSGGKVWRWRVGVAAELYAELAEANQSRFNDVIAGPLGELYCGVAPLERGGQGSLWRLSPNRTFTCIEPATKGMPNGMGFSPDLRHLYFSVTSEGAIYRYDYDLKTGIPSNRQLFVAHTIEDGLPDGLTVDAEGCIWSARWNGRKLVRYSPYGSKLQEYRLPCPNITSLTFGGPDYSTLYITTANYPWNQKEHEQCNAGSVFSFDVSTFGKSEFQACTDGTERQQQCS